MEAFQNYLMYYLDMCLEGRPKQEHIFSNDDRAPGYPDTT